MAAIVLLHELDHREGVAAFGQTLVMNSCALAFNVLDVAAALAHHKVTNAARPDVDRPNRPAMRTELDFRL